MDEKEKCTNCENFNADEPRALTREELPEFDFVGDMPDEVIIIPVKVYKHLIRCEATMELMDKLLDKYGEYSSERTKIVAIACELLRKEGPADA